MATSAGILQIASRGTFQYLPGNYPWSEMEEAQLAQALTEFPEGSFSGSERYVMIASKIPTKTIRDVVMKLRSDSSEKPLSGLIDAAAERKIEQKFAQSLQFLNQFRTNLLEEHPRFDKNEAILKDFIRNSKELIEEMKTLPVQMPRMPLKLKTIEDEPANTASNNP